jgi:hypothetical protein
MGALEKINEPKEEWLTDTDIEDFKKVLLANNKFRFVYEDPEDPNYDETYVIRSGVLYYLTHEDNYAWRPFYYEDEPAWAIRIILGSMKEAGGKAIPVKFGKEVIE